MGHRAEKEKILARLKKIEGQVRGIMNMIEDETKHTPCDQVLIQVGAVNSALHKVGQLVLENHLQCCVVDAIKAGNEVETMKKLTLALERFAGIR